ncbi:helix-turn-helix domain-containing protein [Liquorilactobacillus sp.]|uniref:helix-turn-helix domain-containing protein n=1 Tax=Liquorilactobacillus sp. TaxID=2767923 RepID=UPI0039EB90B9
MTKEIVEQTLIKNNYNKTLTAKELEISRSTLWRILKESSGCEFNHMYKNFIMVSLMISYNRVP